MKLEKARAIATPTPVELCDKICQFKVHIVGNNGWELCESQASPISRTDFPLIAHCYNKFDELVEALERCAKGSGPDVKYITVFEIEQILARAKEVEGI